MSVRGTARRLIDRFPAALALPTAFSITLGGVSVSPGTGMGTVAIFLAILGDFYTKAAVTIWRVTADTSRRRRQHRQSPPQSYPRAV